MLSSQEVQEGTCVGEQRSQAGERTNMKASRVWAASVLSGPHALVPRARLQESLVLGVNEKRCFNSVTRSFRKSLVWRFSEPRE